MEIFFMINSSIFILYDFTLTNSSDRFSDFPDILYLRAIILIHNFFSPMILSLYVQ